MIERTIRPGASSVDAGSTFPSEALTDLADEGLGVLLMPKTLGGAETSTATYAEALARIAAACGSTSTVYMTQMHCAHPIHLQASPRAGRDVDPAPLRRVGGGRHRADRAQRGL